jgi:hypothetical protein
MKPQSKHFIFVGTYIMNLTANIFESGPMPTP